MRQGADYTGKRLCRKPLHACLPVIVELFEALLCDHRRVVLMLARQNRKLD